MELLRSPVLSEEDLKVFVKWRNLLREEAAIKGIPKALVSAYVNEKVYFWIQSQKIQVSPDEYNILTTYFPPTNWESVSLHDHKIAVVLCASVTFHTYHSALLRIREPGFMSQFMIAHNKDRYAEKELMRRIGSGCDYYYFGRSIEELFNKFLDDHLK